MGYLQPKVYVIVSMDGGIPHVEAVHDNRDDSINYFRELLMHMGGQWDLGDNNGNCVMYAAQEETDSDLRLYERNLL